MSMSSLSHQEQGALKQSRQSAENLRFGLVLANSIYWPVTTFLVLADTLAVIGSFTSDIPWIWKTFWVAVCLLLAAPVIVALARLVYEDPIKKMKRDLAQHELTISRLVAKEIKADQVMMDMREIAKLAMEHDVIQAVHEDRPVKPSTEIALQHFHNDPNASWEGRWKLESDREKLQGDVLPPVIKKPPAWPPKRK